MHTCLTCILVFLTLPTGNSALVQRPRKALWYNSSFLPVTLLNGHMVGNTDTHENATVRMQPNKSGFHCKRKNHSQDYSDKKLRTRHFWHTIRKINSNFYLYLPYADFGPPSEMQNSSPMIVYNQVRDERSATCVPINAMKPAHRDIRGLIYFKRLLIK